MKGGWWWSGPGRRGWRPLGRRTRGAGAAGRLGRGPGRGTTGSGRSGARTPSSELQNRLTSHPDDLPAGHLRALEPADGSHLLRLQTGAADAPGTVRTVVAAALVLATGAYDRALPFPAGTCLALPRTARAGAGQGQGIAVGQRVLVAGTGPFLLPVAASLVAAGAHVTGVLEANRATAIGRTWLGRPRSRRASSASWPRTAWCWRGTDQGSATARR